jgi:hypothetical protein
MSPCPSNNSGSPTVEVISRLASLRCYSLPFSLLGILFLVLLHLILVSYMIGSCRFGTCLPTSWSHIFPLLNLFTSTRLTGALSAAGSKCHLILFWVMRGSFAHMTQWHFICTFR